MEEVTVLALADFAAVRLKCRQCQTAVSIPIDTFTHSVPACPGCGVGWFARNGTTEGDVRSLIQYIRRLRDLASGPDQCLLLLERAPKAVTDSRGTGGV